MEEDGRVDKRGRMGAGFKEVGGGIFHLVHKEGAI